MFTGIIETLGVIKDVQKRNKSYQLVIVPNDVDFLVSEGGSVAVDGVCLTVESIKGKMLTFTAVHETLAHTTLARIRAGNKVNLERALSVSGRFDGHIVQGHVDGMGRIINDKTVGESVLRTIWIPDELRPFIVHKGSLAIDGISLTIAEQKKESVTVSIIPYTLSATTFMQKKIGQSVNLECDILARYIFHQLYYIDKPIISQNQATKKQQQQGQKNLLSLLEKSGF